MSTADTRREPEGHEAAVNEAAVHEREVIVERRGSLGVLTLNRPAAINALTACHDLLTDQATSCESCASDSRQG